MEKTKILAVDDDLTTRLILESCLKDWGYEPIICKNGREVIDKMKSPNPPNFLILDWMMPGMDGLELCKRLKNRESDQPYILMLTSRDTRADQINALDAGADDYLTKPYKNYELKEKIEKGLA